MRNRAEKRKPRPSDAKRRKTPLRELAALFFKLGTIAFGGPAAHIAMMEDEVVRRRRWMTNDEFLDLLGATNLIPGPNSTEMAIHIGHRRAGWKGLLVAGASYVTVNGPLPTTRELEPPPNKAVVEMITASAKSESVGAR